MIHYISPYRVDKNIGKAINDAIKQISPDDEDWIVHCDHDILWLLPESKQQLENILSTTEFDVLGPLTNRLGSKTQLYHEEFSEETDILEHIQIAKDFIKGNYAEIKPLKDGVLAAFCLCFKVKTWKKLGGFAENTLQFDWHFSENARKMDFKLGIMTGIYVYHLYRTGKDKSDFTHLI